jgi:hypothetical protein
MRKLLQVGVLTLILLSSVNVVSFVGEAGANGGGLSDSLAIPSHGTVQIVYVKMDFEVDPWGEVAKWGGFAYYDDGWYPRNPLYTELVTDIVREGHYACKFTLPDPSTNARSKIAMGQRMRALDLKEAYFGFSIYIPGNFTLTSSSDWFDFIESDVSPSYAASWELAQGANYWFIYTMIGTRRVVYSTGQLLPKERWIDFVVYCLYDRNGNVKVWMNGAQVCNVFYDTTGGETKPFLEFGAYENSNGHPNSVIFDNVIVASTYAACQMP